MLSSLSSVQPSPPGFEVFSPRLFNGVAHFPLYYMRGGTSTGVVLWEPHLPAALALKEELIRRIMGVPVSGETKGNKQVNGLGRGLATSNKVFMLNMHEGPEADLSSTLAQLAADRSAIDWSVNCGNMSAALPLYALETGLIQAQTPLTQLRIFNTNTRVITDARVSTPNGNAEIPADTEIPGVMGAFPGVELSLRHPIGAKTGKLFPTGQRKDVFAGVVASCLDVAVPMVIVKAADLGVRGDEMPDVLNQNQALKNKLREIWVEAGLKMGLKKRNGELMTRTELENSETIPKICMVSPPQGAGHITVRYFTPQSAHGSLAVTGGCCLATACLLPGTVAHDVVRNLQSFTAEERESVVDMENPAGILRARVCGALSEEGATIPWAAYTRNTQVFMRGYVPIYTPSAELSAFFCS
ncbi:PrpF domain-containing protein [Zwartia sp.]|uniref:PrpF domain-containing protein n=1 Tax=Zwartia sp. TaxID=2978004 RepID=UPI0027271992|nr:PrpF domain-containing protein [Zwartia sp.]MDO9024039.1 PrpF domain-containing protein [Zwartia sp.]